MTRNAFMKSDRKVEMSIRKWIWRDSKVKQESSNRREEKFGSLMTLLNFLTSNTVNV